jgi:class 3 adenylate cyclase/DNA-binding CsgD family transcriptional regulator/tetratricopeptide (TPR) repeat protein
MAERSTATTTILFTDVVGSTALRTKLGEPKADEFFTQHLRQLADIVRHHGGVVVKTGGDGVMATFDAASRAVRSATELQVQLTTPLIALRIGIAAGDVSWEDNDCFGLPVVMAARLEAAAEPGQILVSDTVRLLAGDRAGDRYEHVGPLELAGLPAPTDAYAVRWEPLAPADGDSPSPAPFPPSFSASSTQTFVGRSAALSELGAAWEDTRTGPGRVVLVGGEAGTGKTRLAIELGRTLDDSGAAVLYGGCDDDLALPYQPWVQAVDQIVTALPQSTVVDELAPSLAPLSHLLVRVERLLGSVPAPIDDPNTARWRLYEAFTAALAAATARWPTLLVLDDLHWAAPQTLAMLRHLAHRGLPGGLLVVGTFRDTRDEVSEPLAGCLADLRRVDAASRLRLEGLDAAAVADFVAGATGQDLDEDLRRFAAELADRSGGNAFYVGELWHHLVTTGAVEKHGDRWVVRRLTAAAAVPDSVREVVASRLARLSEPARRLVDVAAVAGQSIDLEVVAMATGTAPAHLDEPVNELVAAGVLTPVATTAVAFTFAHSLVRDTVEAAIGPVARRRLRLAVAEAIEKVHEADRRPVLAELARHFAAAAPVGPTDKAVYYGQRAAAQAFRAAAYEEAMVHLERVIGLAPSGTERARALCLIADTQLRVGQYAASREASLEAFELATDAGDVEIAADAALSFETATHFPGLAGGTPVEMLRRAIDMAGDRRAVQLRLRASLGRALALDGHLTEGFEIANSAVVEAREVGDEDSLAVGLQAILTTVDDPLRLLPNAQELARLAERRGDHWSMSYAAAHQFRGSIATGQLDDAADTLATLRKASATGRFAAFLFMAEAMEVIMALAKGDLAAAEAAVERGVALDPDDESPFTAGVYGIQMYIIRRAQGRLSEVAPVIRAVAMTEDPPPLWRPGLAAIYADLGMLDKAREVFDTLTPNSFASVARDSVWPACLTFLAETCLVLGDARQAPVLHDELLEFHNRNLMAGFTMCFGPADRLLGGLAALLGRPADADAHFAAALELADRSAAPMWAAEAQRDWSISLAARGDLDRAKSLARQARVAATVLALGHITDRLPDVVAISTTEVRPDGLSEREVEVLRLVAEGLSNRDIGLRLFISENTVANHVRAILRKTASANRTEAAAYAHRSRLVAE